MLCYISLKKHYTKNHIKSHRTYFHIDFLLRKMGIKFHYTKLISHTQSSILRRGHRLRIHIFIRCDAVTRSTSSPLFNVAPSGLKRSISNRVQHPTISQKFTSIYYDTME